MWNNQRVSLSCAVRIYPNTWKIPCHQTSMTCPSPSTGFQHSLHSFSPTCRKVPQTILCTQAQHAMFHAVSLAEQREKGIKKPTKAVETPPFLAHGPMDFHGVYWCFVCLLEGNWWQPGSQNPHEGFCQLIAFPLRQKIGGSSKKYPSGEQSIYIYIYLQRNGSQISLCFFAIFQVATSMSSCFSPGQDDLWHVSGQITLIPKPGSRPSLLCDENP